ncbi:MAG: preprotein translocase subunit YajC [Clostridiales bacterium]|nr:preprotein translocase subunit YajC [Clostridiales bacterium]
MILTLLSEGLNGSLSSAADSAASAAEAATQAASSGSSGSGGFSPMFWVIYIIGLILLFYFFAVRPNKKREQEKQAVKESIQLGDWVITSGGLYGKVVNIYTDEFMVEFGTNKSITIPIRKDDILGAKKPELTNKPVQEVVDEPKKKKKFGIF